MIRDLPQDFVQGANLQGFVGRNGNSLAPGRFCLQNDMTPGLMNFAISPVPAERFLQVRGRSNLSAISSHRENFVAYEVQSDCLRFGTVKKVAFDSVFDHCPKLLPSVALCDDALRQAHRGITAFGFFLDFKYKLACVGSAHPMSFGKCYHAT